jgi:hypothetical protein
MLATKRFRPGESVREVPELTNRPPATIPAGALEPEVHAAVGSVIKKRRKKMRTHKKKKLLKRARHKRKR